MRKLTSVLTRIGRRLVVGLSSFVTFDWVIRRLDARARAEREAHLAEFQRQCDVIVRRGAAHRAELDRRGGGA